MVTIPYWVFGLLLVLMIVPTIVVYKGFMRLLDKYIEKDNYNIEYPMDFHYDNKPEEKK